MLHPFCFGCLLMQRHFGMNAHHWLKYLCFPYCYKFKVYAMINIICSYNIWHFVLTDSRRRKRVLTLLLKGSINAKFFCDIWSKNNSCSNMIVRCTVTCTFIEWSAHLKGTQQLWLTKCHLLDSVTNRSSHTNITVGRKTKQKNKTMINSAPLKESVHEIQYTY